jgi:hypothetical protein
MWDASVRKRKPYEPVRIAWGTAKAAYKTGAYGITATRATGRGIRTAHRSWRAGWAEGAQRGRERHAAYVAAREERRAAARTAVGSYAFPNFPEKESDDERTHTPVAVPHETEPPYSCEPDDSDPVPGAGEPNPPVLPEGTPSMPASTGGEALNIDQARQVLKEIHTKAADFVTAVDTLSASLQAADMDAQTIGEVADILDAASVTQTAADKAVRGLDSRHAHMEEAVNSTPHAAKTEFYRH